MASAARDLESFLDQLAHASRPGDRLPTIRELMRRFGLSQAVVQRAVAALGARGLISAQVGRGTYFVAPADGAPGPAPEHPQGSRSVLLLRRSISIERGRVLLEMLQRRLTALGHRVIEVAYNDPDHARGVLRALPRFDGCVVQSTYKSIPVDLLAALREKTSVLAVDGLALMGTDVEAVGTEWGEPLAQAVSMLWARGHRRIAYATTTHPILASELGRRRFEHLQAQPGGEGLTLLSLPKLPHLDYEDALVQQLRGRQAPDGRLAFTALVAWGIESGSLFRRLLHEAGLAVPQALSVVLLGRTDLANEHDDFFSVAGCRVADQCEALIQALQARWDDPERIPGTRLVPVAWRQGASVAEARSEKAASPPARRPGAAARRAA